ncbi:MAG: hypothetical protein EBE86_005950 [Hormoscilla sp. GUM202]|nr:hypothetical protein [Hormoscilla sp. GUM202]
MNLDQQIQLLIDQAPTDGSTPFLMEAIAPVLKSIASQLKHSQYYIIQSPDDNWVLTTLSNRVQPELQKNVIYAFPTQKDAANTAYARQDPRAMALPHPVTHILFQMVAMETVDSLVFFETPGNLDAGTEVERADVQKLIFSYMQLLKRKSNNIGSSQSSMLK